MARIPSARSAAWAGRLRADRWRSASEQDAGGFARFRTALGGRAAERLQRTFGGRGALANALVLARREGMDRDLREAFARSGIAHLLSISGFHVGVVAGVLFSLLRLGRIGASRARLAAAGGVWGYVLLIGAPDPAVRAALLLTLFAAARCAGRPLAAEGALAAAFLGMATLDPGAPGRAGFQLSFAGATGLVRLGPPADAFLRRAAPRLPRGLRAGLAAGAGATIATLPIVAWHFERVSLVGVPATLVAGPLVASVIPGLLLVLLLGPLSDGVAAFVGGGTDLLLAALVYVVAWFAQLEWAAVAVSRGLVLAGGFGWAAATIVLSRATGLARGTRWIVLAAGAAVAVLLAPVWSAIADRGTVAIEVLDVGQGDAILIRSPEHRWVLVDAGPRSNDWDAGARVILPALRRRGVDRLEALVLTHPHLDHVGGAAAVLRDVPVGVVLDPGQPFGTTGFVDALEAAQRAGAPWTATERGAALDVDGMALEVLHPHGELVDPTEDPNDVSLVLLLRYGAFTALLMGDAPRAVEEALAADGGPVDVLKVGHHGSETSSSSAFLAEVRPAVALISVGRGNRFGHPHRSALGRLEAAGARVHRTDREGVLAVRARGDGTWTLTSERAPD